MKSDFLYDAIVELKQQLEADHDDPVMDHPDYRKVKALAACYELQDFLSNQISAGHNDMMDRDPEDI